MKFYFMAAAVVMFALVAVFLMQSRNANLSEANEYAEKRMIVEAETKVRPAHFEDMKFKEDTAIELRSPASKE